MSLRWLAVLGLLCGLATTTHSAALSTENTLVVVRNEDELPATQQPSEEPTTEEPLAPLKTTALEVESAVALRYARTSVVARMRNPARRAQEASFRVLLPDTAFISGFTMTLDGKSYKAYVKEKEEAKQIYSDAISHGFGAAHIATKARDSNHFTVSVNVEANTSAVFNLTYEELLARRGGLYSLAVNLHPGAPVPRLAVTVRLREPRRLRTVRAPPVRTGNELDAGDEDAKNPIAVIERGDDDREAVITFKPDLEEQRRLAEIYAAKSKESQSQRYNRFEENGENNKRDEILGQFVVQYDVEQPKNGEILVNDGYFVHLFAPSELPPLNKHAVFVLDTSGSMGGRKIEQLRAAMQTILQELNKGDFFSIVEFDSYVQVHDLTEADKEPLPAENDHYYYSYASKSTKPVMVPPSPATPVNVAKAKVIVGRLTAKGGTNIYDALDTAVELIQKGVDWTPLPESSTTAKQKNITEMEDAGEKEKRTDSYVVEKRADNGSAVGDAKKLEPIIIFLTDGDPTTGETNPTKIINRITEKNYGPNKASLFSLAFGEDADRTFLRKLALRNEGFMRHIYEAADAALQLRAFYRQVASPLLADVTFVYPPDQVAEGSLTRTRFRAVYGGAEAVVAGRVAGAGTALQPQVVGVCGVKDSFSRKRCEVKPVRSQATGYLPLERLWAYLTIKQLLDERDAADSGEGDKDSNRPGKRALELALKYEFVTPLTSLVVVKPNASSAVNAESVDAPYFSRPLALASGAVQPQYFMRSFVPYSMARPKVAPNYPSSLMSLQGWTNRASSIPRPKVAPNYPSSLMSPQGWTNRASNYTLPQNIMMLTTARPDLVKYHLVEFPWVETLLNATTGHIVLPQTSISLQLTEDDEPPKALGGDAECPRATDGAAGRCVYLTRCRATRALTVAQYAAGLHCAVDNKYAGVCCPNNEIDVTSRSV